MQAPEALLKKYENRKGPGLNDTRYGAMIEAMDLAIGRLLASLESLGQVRYGQLASDVLKNDWVDGGNTKVFNQAKISDHFAIIPTLKPAPATLKELEQMIYDMSLIHI